MWQLKQRKFFSKQVLWHRGERCLKSCLLTDVTSIRSKSASLIWISCQNWYLPKSDHWWKIARYFCFSSLNYVGASLTKLFTINYRTISFQFHKSKYTFLHKLSFSLEKNSQYEMTPACLLINFTFSFLFSIFHFSEY